MQFEGVSYTGIGSRKTPKDILVVMTSLANKLSKKGCVLRSGGASGADTAFEEGAGSAKAIFLPWDGFNNRSENLIDTFVTGNDKEARKIAQRFHPAWNKCNASAKKFHTRNVHQILGFDLESPAEFVICWTPYADKSGGTGQAIRIAEEYNIPIYDLGDESTLKNIKSTIK